MLMQRITFRLTLSAEEFLKYYRGAARSVVVTSDDGRSLKFPASALQKFVTNDGVQGRFTLIFDDDNKLAGIERIEGDKNSV